MSRKLEAQATNNTDRIGHAFSVAGNGPVATRKCHTAPGTPAGGSRRREEADPLSRALDPPSDVGGYEVYEKFGPASGQAWPAGVGMFCPPAWAAIARSLQRSGRELQLVRGVFDDQKDPAIAHALVVFIHNIHAHFERLHHELTVNGRSHLVQRVMQGFPTLTTVPDSDLPPICACRTMDHGPRGSGLMPTPGRDPRN